MRRTAVIALLLALVPLTSGRPARAEDEPRVPRPAPPPRPDASGLIERLLSSDADARASAEAAVAKASPEVLRILFFAMRDRAARAEAAAKEPRERAPVAEEAKRSDRGVSQEVRFVSLSPDAAVRLLGVPAGGMEATHRVLTATEAQELLARLAADPAVRILRHPTITAYDRQPASIEVLDQGSYVADMEVQSQGNAFLADPVVQTYRTGLRLESKARVLHDGSSFGVDLEVEVRRRAGPLVEEALPTKEGLPPVKVQRAELVGCRWSRAFAVPPKGTLLVALPPGFSSGDGERLALLWTPSIVPLDAGVPAPSSPAGK